MSRAHSPKTSALLQGLDFHVCFYEDFWTTNNSWYVFDTFAKQVLQSYRAMPNSLHLLGISSLSM